MSQSQIKKGKSAPVVKSDETVMMLTVHDQRFEFNSEDWNQPGTDSLLVKPFSLNPNKLPESVYKVESKTFDGTLKKTLYINKTWWWVKQPEAWNHFLIVMHAEDRKIMAKEVEDRALAEKRYYEALRIKEEKEKEKAKLKAEKEKAREEAKLAREFEKALKAQEREAAKANKALEKKDAPKKPKEDTVTLSKEEYMALKKLQQEAAPKKEKPTKETTLEAMVDPETLDAMKKVAKQRQARS